MTAHRVGLPGPETGRCQHHYRWGTIFHRRAFTKNADPKKGLPDFFPSPKKREGTLISRGFAAFVSLHLYSMSSHLDTKRNSLTSLSRCGTILRKSAPQTQKKEKDLSPDVSVIRRQAKKGGSLLGRASCVEHGLCAGLTFRAPLIGRVLHALRHSVYALGDRQRHAQLLRFPHHIAGHRLGLGLAPGLDVQRHRAGVLRELRLPRSDLLHEVHRIESPRTHLRCARKRRELRHRLRAARLREAVTPDRLDVRPVRVGHRSVGDFRE